MQRTPHRTSHETHMPKTPSRTPLKDTANTQLPRREGSDRKERWQEGGSEEVRVEGKRENARNRCFDLRVNNIATIHDKIYGLLSLIKRDKVEEPAPKPQQERGGYSGKHHLAAYGNPSTKERLDAFNAARLQNLQNIINQRQALAAVSTISKETPSEHREEYIYKKSFDYAPKNNQKTPNTSDRLNTHNGPSKADKTPVKRSYLPAEYEHKPTLTPKAKSNKNQFVLDEVEYQKYEIRIERRNDDSITSKPQSNNLYETGQQRHQQRERRVEKMESRQIEAKLQAKFQKISVELEKRQERERQQNSKKQKQNTFTLPQSIPKPQASKFKPIALADQSTRAQKLTTTTKLIDQQIKRIKSKIEESENHSQWMNSKLERQREDRSAISQTYMQQEEDE